MPYPPKEPLRPDNRRQFQGRRQQRPVRSNNRNREAIRRRLLRRKGE
jgi:hypothetical protein